MRRRLGLAAGLLAGLTLAPAATAQVSSLTKAPGPEYSAGGLYRFLLGREYRALWTTPITVPVLDLCCAEGGLRPVGKTGGQQTHTLRLRNPEGREFFFRSIDKDPSAALPPSLRTTVAGDVVRDQTSSGLPTGPLVVAPLLSAAGVLHDETRLVILPDDTLLGDFRAGFAGTIGTLEGAIGGKAGAHWGGALEIIDSDTLEARTGAGPADRMDVRAFLTARLMDVFLGDWDRHRDQWRWARFNDDLPRWWRPVPLDRDQAFVKYDGFLLAIARQSVPQLVNFGPEYPVIIGATWNGRDLDRRYLVNLEWTVWDSVARRLQAALTDSVIASAVAALPPPEDSLIGNWLGMALRHRRDQLPEAARRFYRLLAKEVDVHATSMAEVATLTREPDGMVEVALTLRDSTVPYFVRRFHPRETDEVRLFLEGGNDSVVVRGPGGGTTLRVVTEGASAVLVDSAPGRADHFYAADAPTGRTAGLGTHIDRRTWVPPPNPNPRALPPRDWGSRWQWSLWSSFGPDVGLFFGLGRTKVTYGFRKLPFASRQSLRAGFATGPGSYRIEYRGEFHHENSRLAAELLMRASGIEVIRFDGFGNETTAPRGDEFYRVTQDQFRVEPSLRLPLADRLTLSLGPTLKYVSTDNRPNRFLATLDPYGVGNFGELGAKATLRYDSRNGERVATRGMSLEVTGRVHPAWWDAVETFGDVAGEAQAFLSPKAPLDPTFAFRLGGRKLWGGRYPYFEAAFIGDRSTVRLGRDNRFAGDASAYGTAELRLTLGHAVIVVPTDVGIFGLADLGRVWLARETSNTWHEAFGGGLSLGFLGRANTLSVALVASDERTRVYAQAGFGF